MLTSLLWVTARLFGGLCVRRPGHPCAATFVLGTPLSFFFLRLLRLTFTCHSLWLLEHGGYEIGGLGRAAIVTWYLLLLNGHSLSLIFSWGQGETRSIERYFRSARWLERENAELLDLWYAGKRDRRALFVLPLFFWAPLRRAFPTGGFFDFRLAEFGGRLVPVHIAWLE